MVEFCGTHHHILKVLQDETINYEIKLLIADSILSFILINIINLELNLIKIDVYSDVPEAYKKMIYDFDITSKYFNEFKLSEKRVKMLQYFI